MTVATVEEEIVLSDEELGVVRRFLGIIEDMGFQALVSFVLTTHAGTEPSFSAQAMGIALEDLIGSCEVDKDVVSRPQGVVDAALSLQLVTSIVQHYPDLKDTIPQDFIPSDELVQRCLSVFFDKVRVRASAPADS